MEQQQRDKTDRTILRILAGMFIFVSVAGLIGIVMAAIAGGSLEELIGGVVKLGLIVIVLAGIGVVLFKVFGVSWLAIITENHRHTEDMAGKGYLPNNNRYRSVKEIAPPEPLQIQAPPDTPQVDPRHALLVSLCLMTVRAEGYGPTSKRLLSCDDAQDISSNRGGQFAKRDSWDAASKYGQEIGWLYTQIGGPAQEQGLKIKIEGGGCTVTDLLDALHQRNLIRDGAVNALPTFSR